MIEVLQYVTPNGVNVFDDWMQRMKDKKALAVLAARLERLTDGNLGDCKQVGGGVLELRIHYGPGYRIYLTRLHETCVLLLCGGDKRHQSADIARAIEYLKDYRRRSANP